ncbi:hypothetical protein SAMN06265222_105305 [Neorhodopirellula lusitana]|uniref:Uncharacterized protein n=1 Tax=Neorhodopirellula lusitana TaxID=445327 RepID=A0ABY1Q3C7_9BACT|nr:hypothetical protein SAMN06265222_105305 [Neorhodopirellula lusitana]
MAPNGRPLLRVQPRFVAAPSFDADRRVDRVPIHGRLLAAIRFPTIMVLEAIAILSRQTGILRLSNCPEYATGRQNHATNTNRSRENAGQPDRTRGRIRQLETRRLKT